MANLNKTATVKLMNYKRTSTSEAINPHRTKTTNELVLEEIVTALAKSGIEVTNGTNNPLQTPVYSQYKDIYWKELISYPNNHIGEKVKIKGTVFQIVSNSQLQMYIGDSLDKVYVVALSPFSRIYAGDDLYVYGVVGGKECFKNPLNATICLPLIQDAIIEKQ